MIDLLMEELEVESVAEWGEGGTPPLYPPPSLPALLNLYLLADVDLSLKHRIVQYLFLDLSGIPHLSLSRLLWVRENSFETKLKRIYNYHDVNVSLC